MAIVYGGGITDYFSKPKPIWSKERDVVKELTDPGTEVIGLVSPLAIVSPFTKSGGLLSKLGGKIAPKLSKKLAGKGAAAVAPTRIGTKAAATVPAKVVTKTISKTIAKGGGLRTILAAGGVGLLAGMLFGQGQEQKQQQDLTQKQQTTGEFEARTTVPTVITPVVQPVSTQTTETYSPTYGYETYYLQAQRDLFASLTGGGVTSPTQVTPEISTRVETKLDQLLAQLQAQMPGMGAIQEQEAEQKGGLDLLSIAALAGVAFLILRDKNQ